MEPAHALPRGLAMNDDERVYRLDEVLTRPDGTRRTPEEAARAVGWRAVWLAQLGEALREIQRRPRPLSLPTRIFISYRWESEAKDRWVARVVARLRALGNTVIHDRELQQQDQPPSVPDLVAQIATAHVFLAVLDPGYVERTGTWNARTAADGWVFDEWQTALGLQKAGRVKVLGLLREETDLPDGFAPLPRGAVVELRRCRGGTTYDVRDPSSLDQVLDRAFRWQGPSLSEAELDRANRLYTGSQEALSGGQTDPARRLARQLADEFPQVPDGFAQLAWVAFTIDDHLTVLAETRRALAIDPDFTAILPWAALSAYMQKDHLQAIRYGTAALRGGADDAMAHYAIGDALDESLLVYPALAHLELARIGLPTALVLNDTGMAYRRARLPKEALSCFEEAIGRSPGDDTFRVNAVAAAIEAGDGPSAHRHLRALTSRHPQHSQLGQVLADWERRGGPPPGLMQRLKPRSSIGTVTCTHCKAWIPLVAWEERLCAECGAERIDEPGPCQLCEHEGEITPALDSGPVKWQCPYCRRGYLTFSPAG